MNHKFGESDSFTVGLEEELLLVDAETLQLAHVADRILPNVGLPGERVDHEAFLAEIEVRSNPARSVSEAVGQLKEGRSAATSAGATLMAAGLHPDARMFDVELVRSERYERVETQMQGLIKRTPECALHVHVGVPDTDAAVAAMNGIRERLPLLHGLGANSPFWFGSDSGMASSRAAVIRAYPGRGIPPVLRSWDSTWPAWTRSARGGPTDHTMVWWDARPQPRLGTVELREVDSQTDLESAAAIAALARAIMRRAVEAPCERSGARAGAPLVELQGRARRPRRRDLVRRLAAPAPRGGGGRARPDRRRRRPGARGHQANRPRGQRGGPAASRLQRRRHAGPAPLPRGRNYALVKGSDPLTVA